MRISENVCMPKGYSFLAMLMVVFYYDANIQKITDKSSKCIQISLRALLLAIIIRNEPSAKQKFISESRLGRALTKNFLHIPFVVTPYGFMISFGEWALRERCSRHPLQAPKERSCGIGILSSSLGSAKRDSFL